MCAAPQRRPAQTRPAETTTLRREGIELAEADEQRGRLTAWLDDNAMDAIRLIRRIRLAGHTSDRAGGDTP